MKITDLLAILILLLLVLDCDRDDGEKKESPEGCIYISELETKQDYYLPFALKNDNDNIQLAILNSDTIDFSYGDYIEFNENGFYELILIYNNSLQGIDSFLFTTKTEERENSEWGIRAWIPSPFETILLGSEDIEIYYPPRYTDSIKIPFIFYIKESGTIKPVYCQGEYSITGETFNIKRGVGSVNVLASSVSNQVQFNVGGKQIFLTLTRISEPFTELTGTVDTDVEVQANSIIRIKNSLDISSAGSLTVHEGSLILIDEAVDINISGPVIFAGTPGNPVLVTCSQDNKFWGGFITRVPGGTIDAQYTIFCQSGYHDSEGYNWGHSGRQALFYTENSTLSLDHCFMLDHISQIFYPQYANLILEDILVQRAQTGGQINTSDLTIRNSVFTDFPDDSYIFRDADNDALYLSESDALIENTTFMFAKDDGVDAGNTEGDEIVFTKCRFEACFHEGAALSSGGTVNRNHTFMECVFTNCGQGLELGFSSPNHMVIAENCMFLDNGIGIRYGDNYNWSDIKGTMLIKNSYSLYNDKDVWNMVRKIWSPRLENLNFENTVVSEFCPQYPELEIINEKK